MEQKITIEFDGVCFTSSVPQGTLVSNDVVEGKPTPGLFEFLESTSKSYDVIVVSPRCSTEAGREAVLDWLEAQHLEWAAINNRPPKELPATVLQFLPDAALHIGTRVFRFEGAWPVLEMPNVTQ